MINIIFEECHEIKAQGIRVNIGIIGRLKDADSYSDFKGQSVVGFEDEKGS
jgi:hypothetical protein